MDVVAREGSLATVYVDRVNALADIAGRDRAELLGLAIAHEIGHVLLGTSAHAAVGLMLATWTAYELRRRWSLDWMFGEQECLEMRRRLAERAALPMEEGLNVAAP